MTFGRSRVYIFREPHVTKGAKSLSIMSGKYFKSGLQRCLFGKEMGGVVIKVSFVFYQRFMV
jgi:hypothetical protein